MPHFVIRDYNVFKSPIALNTAFEMITMREIIWIADPATKGVGVADITITL